MSSKLEILKQIQDRDELAKLLGFTPKALSYILYLIPDTEKYRTFDIPKKRGGTRTIKAPTQRLALLQSRLDDLISECVEEISSANPRFQAASHGFCKGKTILSNANAHRRRRYVFNIDIADFFGSINFGRVRGFFIKDKNFRLPPNIATIIAQIACHDNALPQGSPCSPIISNLIANILDVRLLRLAKEARCTYTRYADDLTFSTNERIFPNTIAREIGGANWITGDGLTKIIESSGFRLNLGKTRMSLRNSRQTVTGLVVNIKPNISQDYYRTVRAMCNSLFRSGQWHRASINNASHPDLFDDLRPIEGMLSYIYFVKGRTDRGSKTNKLAQYTTPRAVTDLYKDFLFYKHFVALKRPLIVTEGISDIAYIKCALRSRAGAFPSLASLMRGRLEPSFTFLTPSGTSRTILDLGNGAAGQNKLISEYANRLKRYTHLPLGHAVIILCDNDEGPKDVFKTAKKLCGRDVGINTTDLFYHLGYNMYLVKVPEGTPAGTRDIEDLFPSSILSMPLDGKHFNKKKEHGDPTSYGKVAFAEKIVRPNVKSIDFSQFDDLLRRIEACIIDYGTKSSLIPAARTSAGHTTSPT